MNEEQRIAEGMKYAERLRHAMQALAETREAHALAELEAYANRSIVNGRNAEVRKAQARQFTSGLQRKIDECETEIAFCNAAIRLLSSAD